MSGNLPGNFNILLGCQLLRGGTNKNGGCESVEAIFT